MIKKLCLMALLVTSCTTTSNVDMDQHRSLAKDLIELTAGNTDEITRSAMNTAMEPLIISLEDQGIEQIKINQVKVVIDEYINDFVSDPSLKSQMIDLYAGEFNPSELSELISFYEQPVGKKSFREIANINKKKY